MNTAQIPMPGALRLRNLHALDAQDGACDLIYDLERGMVLEVPSELQAYVSLALDRTEPTEEMLSWLIHEDLLTSDRFAEGGDAEDLSASGIWSTASGDREWQLDRPTEAELFELIEGVFRPGGERGPVKIRCHWDVGFPGVMVLRRFLSEARRLAGANRRAISFEITLPVSALDEPTVRYLADETFPLRVLAGPVALCEAERKLAPVLASLAHRLGDRLTLGLDFVRGVRLRDAWKLAESSGIQHLDIAWPSGEEPRSGGELRDLVADLQTISEEICSGLEAQAAPIDFQPLTRLVGRLLQREPMFDFDREPVRRPAWIGDVDSTFGLRDMEPSEVASLWEGVDGFGGEARTTAACEGCWARYICAESRMMPAFSAAPEPVEQRCELLRVLFEAGVRLHYRLSQMDPLATQPFLELALRASSDPRRGAIGARC